MKKFIRQSVLATLVLTVTFSLGFKLGIESKELEAAPPVEKIIVEKEVIFMHPYGTPKNPYREDIHGDIECSCVRAVRSFGANIPYGTDASELEPNTDIEIGSVAIFNTPQYSHVAIVTEIDGDSFLVKEGNYVKCQITERRVQKDDYRLIGFWKDITASTNIEFKE